jgi:hypothetical protein
MAREVTSADMMEARDAVGRAYYVMKAADAAWDAAPSEMTNAAAARAQREWARAVRDREAMERRMWAQQDAA